MKATAKDLTGEQKPTKPWTVAIYMVADGPEGNRALDRAAENELVLIKDAATAAGSELHVAVQADLKVKKKIRRLIVGRDEELSPEENAADPDTLSGFFDWVASECPAERYLVQFWGHSSGPVGLFADAGGSGVPETISLIELDKVFQRATKTLGRDIDIVLFKDCWMSTLEAVFELEGLAKFLIASPALVVPRFGWPYAEIFKCLTAASSGAKREGRAAMDIVEQLGLFYESAKNRADKVAEFDLQTSVKNINDGKVGHEVRDEVPYALLDVGATSRIVEPMANLVKHLTKGLKGPAGSALRRALESATRGDPALVDLVLLCDKLSSFEADAALREHAAHVKRVVFTNEDRLILDRWPKQSAFGGVSLFRFPLEVADMENSFIALHTTKTEYRRLKLSKRTDWDAVALVGAGALQPA